MKDIEIGYLCGRGHYCFDSDPDEDGACRGKKIATIYVRLDEDMEFYPRTPGDPGFTEQDYLDTVEESNDFLGEQLNTWRNI